MPSLRNTMLANAASCLLFGLIFLFLSSSVIYFLSENDPAPTLLVQLLGASLIFNGLHLFWTTKRATPRKVLILYFATGDILWVIGTLALLISQQWIDTISGVLTSCAIAVLVGYFGLVQIVKATDKEW